MARTAGLRGLVQLTLDLFEPPPAAAPAPAPAVAAPAGPPAEPLSAVLAPASFHHPRGNRQSVLDGTVVGYLFERARRRSIGFTVGPEGLVVRAPGWVPLREVESALQARRRWILGKLQEARSRLDRRESVRIAWGDGAEFPFLGAPVRVVLDPRRDWGAGGAVLRGAGPGGAAEPAGPLALHVGLPQQAGPEQVRDAVQAWLMGQARRLFTERLDHFAPQLGVRWQRLVLSSAATRWGTAHADGTIRLNWRLMHLRLPVIDYVVAHELAHLRVMDHSPRFWETVATVVPDWKDLRGQLREDPVPPW